MQGCTVKRRRLTRKDAFTRTINCNNARHRPTRMYFSAMFACMPGYQRFPRKPSMRCQSIPIDREYFLFCSFFCFVFISHFFLYITYILRLSMKLPPRDFGNGWKLTLQENIRRFIHKYCKSRAFFLFTFIKLKDENVLCSLGMRNYHLTFIFKGKIFLIIFYGLNIHIFFLF